MSCVLTIHFRLWPKAADLGGASSRKLSRVHRTCCRRGRNGSPCRV